MDRGKSEEFFDVVDEEDQVIDQVARSEVHRRKLRHRAVHVFLFRPDACLLIHKRSDTKEEFPSVWTSSCSGHVSAGKTTMQRRSGSCVKNSVSTPPFSGSRSLRLAMIHHRSSQCCMAAPQTRLSRRIPRKFPQCSGCPLREFKTG